MKFSQLGLIEPLIRAVTSAGHTAPTPIQALTIPEVLTGKDVIGAAEAGTGKTGAFALPVLQRLSQSTPKRHALSRRVRALIVTATRDLAEEIGKDFARYGRYCDLHCLALVEPDDTRHLSNPLRSVDILITTPERLMELQQHGGVDLRAVEILVIDEADRMLDMGSLPDVQRIISQLPLDRQTLMFTATLPQAINSLADIILRSPARIRIPPTQKVAGVITQSVCFVERPNKTSMLVAWLGDRAVNRAVVFTRTRQAADRVVRQLLTFGVRAEAIHAEKSMAARQQTLQRFRSSNPPVLVATDLAARGIDVTSISHVVNYDLPLEPETYVHRIGRISQAGNKGMSVSLCDDSERTLLKGIERLLRREIPVDEKTKPVERPVRPQPEPPPPATSSRRSRRRAPSAALAPVEPVPAAKPSKTDAKSKSATRRPAAKSFNADAGAQKRSDSPRGRTAQPAAAANGKTRTVSTAKDKSSKPAPAGARNTASARTPAVSRTTTAARTPAASRTAVKSGDGRSSSSSTRAGGARTNGARSGGQNGHKSNGRVPQAHGQKAAAQNGHAPNSRGTKPRAETSQSNRRAVAKSGSHLQTTAKPTGRTAARSAVHAKANGKAGSTAKRAVAVKSSAAKPARRR